MWDCLADTYCLLAGYRRGSTQVYGYKNRLMSWAIILLALLLAAFMLGGVNAQEEPPVLTEEPPPPTEEPPLPTEEPPLPTEEVPNPPAPPDYLNNPSPQSPAPVWTGLSDGRLNPNPAEYYSIWCSDNFVHVRVVVPEPAEVKAISTSLVLGLPVDLAWDVGDFMTVLRNSADTITIYGSNGNGAPEPGEKAFSWNQCIEQNGGTPDVIAAVPASSQESNPEAGNGDSGVIPIECMSSTGLYFLLCVSENADSGVEIFFKWIAEVCYPLVAVVIPGGSLALHFRRRRR